MTETTAEPPTAPGIGEPFLHDGEPFAVRGWMRRTDQPGPPAGPDRCPLVFCLRDDAEYVISSGLPGRILRVADVQADPRPVWQESTISAAHAMAEHLNGQIVHPHVPKGQSMNDRRGIRDITFTNNGTAIQIRYRVIADHTATVPLKDLPFDVDEVYAAHDIDTDGDDERTKLDAIVEKVESHLGFIVGVRDLVEYDHADSTDIELTVIAST